MGKVFRNFLLIQCVIFQKVQPAFMEFTVKANLLIEPDGAFLLEGATAKLQLFEHSGILDKEGNPTKVGE